MSTTRTRGVSGSAQFLPVLLLAVLATAVACVSAPEEAPGEAPAAAEPESGSAGDPRPEVVEIRGPASLPVRMVLVLPDPEPKAAPGAASRLPPPQAAPAASAASPELADSADAPPAPPTPAQSVPSTEPPAPAAEPPQAAATPAKKPAETKSATPAPLASQKPSDPAPAPKASTVPAKPAAPAPKPPAAKPPASATGAASPPAAETATPARPAPSLAPAPGSSARTVPEPAPTPGRTEEAVRGSPLELPFRGSGWVYLGETGGRDGLRYETRKFDGSQAVFLFTAERPGEYQLRFQRQDSFSGDPENLLVKVLVREPEPAASDGSAARATAAPALSAPPASSGGISGSAQVPGSASSSSGSAVVPPAAAPTGSAAEAAPASGSPVTAPPRELPSTPEALLRLAREDLAAARIAGVLEALDRYLVLFPFGSDEAHYLYGKAYEQNTPYRDIKKAYANYRKVRDEWPRSTFWKESSERVTYIERHYFDIR